MDASKRGITVVVGGQFGGEGKGKVTAHLCRNYGYDAAVRCGGPNSGHTVTIGNEQVILRQIPAGIVNPDTKLFLSAGCLIDLNVLSREIELFNLTPDTLGIDRNAVIIEKEDIEEERRGKLKDRIGSTCTGVGAAVAKRILRRGNITLAKDSVELESFVLDVSQEIMALYESGRKIVIEGTQGFGLSVYHSPYYPYATSRDTTASAFLSEIGVSPLTVSEIIMVIRTFPIRVGGNSGPLPKEIDWETIERESGYPYRVEEYTTVTNRLRRVGRFDVEIVKKAVMVNKPTRVALMGVDYLDCKNKSEKVYTELTHRAKEFILNLQEELRCEISFIGTGPRDDELIDLVLKQEDEVENERRRLSWCSTSKR
jgi:adenylosuccinate synthase